MVWDRVAWTCRWFRAGVLFVVAMLGGAWWGMEAMFGEIWAVPVRVGIDTCAILGGPWGGLGWI